jgi:hypothetical protein
VLKKISPAAKQEHLIEVRLQRALVIECCTTSSALFQSFQERSQFRSNNLSEINNIAMQDMKDFDIWSRNLARCQADFAQAQVGRCIFNFWRLKAK